MRVINSHHRRQQQGLGVFEVVVEHVRHVLRSEFHQIEYIGFSASPRRREGDGGGLCDSVTLWFNAFVLDSVRVAALMSTLGSIARVSLLCLVSAVTLRGQAGPNEQRARDVYKQLVEINTTDTPAGNVTKAAEAMAARLKAAGFPAADVQVLGPDPR